MRNVFKHALNCYVPLRLREEVTEQEVKWKISSAWIWRKILKKVLCPKNCHNKEYDESEAETKSNDRHESLDAEKMNIDM